MNDACFLIIFVILMIIISSIVVLLLFLLLLFVVVIVRIFIGEYFFCMAKVRKLVVVLLRVLKELHVVYINLYIDKNVSL